MIILTARLPRAKSALAVALATVSCSAYLVFGLVKEPYETAMLSHSKQQDQRISFLEDYGWKVEEIPLSSQTLLIPDPLDESYQDYMSLQVDQGFPSLTQFQGEVVERYTYVITNYPTGEANVQVNLLVYEDEIIGGEVLSPQVNGFLHGLSMPE